MFAVAANDPLPYRPIRIIDVSPIRSSLRARPAGVRSGRRRRAAIAAVIAGVLAVAAVSVGAGAAPATTSVAGDFRLGPGHAMPASLAADGGVAGDFRLGPGHAMPADLGPR